MKRKIEKFADLLKPTEYRWPKKGDKLFKRSEDLNSSTGFANSSTARDAHIWRGYMTAGSVLVDYCKDDNVDRFDLVYPILFNYRHGLETAMKWVLNH